MSKQLISQLTVLTSKTGRATSGCCEIPGVIELGLGKNGERRLSFVTGWGGGHNNPFYPGGQPLPAAVLILFPPLIRTTVDNGWLNQGSSLQRSDIKNLLLFRFYY